jgi:hypothetical protein
VKQGVRNVNEDGGLRPCLKQEEGGSLLANLTMEDGSWFRNFTGMKTSDFEFLAIVTGSECRDRELIAQSIYETTFDSLFLLAC